MEKVDPSFCSGFFMEPVCLTMRPPGVTELGKLIWTLLQGSELHGWVNPRDAEDLVVICGGDVRRCLGTIACLSSSSGASGNRRRLESHQVDLALSDFQQWLVRRGILGSGLDQCQCLQAGAMPLLESENRSLHSTQDNTIRLQDTVHCTTESLLSYMPSALDKSSSRRRPALSPGASAIPSAGEEGLEDEDEEERAKGADGISEKEGLNASIERNGHDCSTSLSAEVRLSECTLFSPIVMSVEPRHVDMWKGGVVYIHGKNFMQRSRNGSASQLTDIIVAIGDVEYSKENITIYSDNEIGLMVSPLLTRPTDPTQLKLWKYRTMRAPKLVKVVEVCITYGCHGSGRLSSSLSTHEKAWISYTDGRAPDEIMAPPPKAHQRPPLGRPAGRRKGSRKRLRKKSSVQLPSVASPASFGSDCDSVVESVDEVDGRPLSLGRISSGGVTESDDDFEEDAGYFLLKSKRLRRVEGEDEGLTQARLADKAVKSGRRNIIDDDEDDDDSRHKAISHEGGDDERSVLRRSSSANSGDIDSFNSDDDEDDPREKCNDMHSLTIASNIDHVGVMTRILAKLKSQSFVEAFLLPVDPVQEPNYAVTVDSPMDIGTIADSVEENLYETVDEFLQDMEKVWSNCFLYDGFGEDVKAAAAELQTFVTSTLEDILADPPLLSPSTMANESGVQGGGNHLSMLNNFIVSLLSLQYRHWRRRIRASGRSQRAAIPAKPRESG